MTQHLHTRNEEKGLAVQNIYRANCHWLANLNYVACVCTCVCASARVAINVVLGSTSSHEMTGDYIGSFNWVHTSCLWRPSAPFRR